MASRAWAPGEALPEMWGKWAGVIAAMAVALPGFADEVVLRNGSLFTGVVREEGDNVILEVDFGTVTFRRSEVREIRRTEDPLKEYDRRYKEARDARGYYALGLWAREKGLTTRSNELFQKVISLDPDHEGARGALGYERFEGRWLAGDDLMLARGYVKHEGRWLKREMVERLLEQENQARTESERQAAAERIARMRREVEMERLAVERERVEWENRRFCFHWVSWFPSAGWVRRPPPAAERPRLEKPVEKGREKERPGRRQEVVP